MPGYCNGRDLTASVLKIFFIHFNNTSYIVERGDEVVGFLIGFLSQTCNESAYIHFAGVSPEHRNRGIGKRLYQRFFTACTSQGRTIVISCTSPINKLSVGFHLSMGFSIEPGDSTVDGLATSLHYLRENDPKVIFKKELQRRN